jgi:pimeloyl-ACP methyl ester carboxylesterase
MTQYLTPLDEDSELAEQIRHNFKLAGLSVTSPTENTCRTEIDIVVKKKVVIFYIGGAADKEVYYFQGPFHNIALVRDFFDLLVTDLDKRLLHSSYYLDYAEAKGADDIQKNVIDQIADKGSPVYIVGHSLGGWNGAHLSTLLAEKGFNVEMLITLDPVGEGVLVSLGSDIYFSTPKPVAKFWVNLRANPKVPDQSDKVASFGERWTVTSGPDLNYVADINHYDAKKMFLAPLKDKKSAADLMLDSIRRLTN